MTHNEKRKALRQERRSKGLCQDCGKIAVPGSSNCIKHKKKRAEANVRRAHKRRKEGRCYSCGRKLDKLLSDNTWACVYCDNRIRMYILIHGRK